MKKVLFVCIGNTCRSQMAKGFFNALTSSISVDNAGIQPEERVDPSAVKVMDEIGIDISSFKPKGLTSAMNNVFDIIVTMGCSGSCPLTPREKTIAWDIEDPKGKSLEIYRNVRDIIKSHVETLINDIVKGEQ